MIDILTFHFAVDPIRHLCYDGSCMGAGPSWIGFYNLELVSNLVFLNCPFLERPILKQGNSKRGLQRTVAISSIIIS